MVHIKKKINKTKSWKNQAKCLIYTHSTVNSHSSCSQCSLFSLTLPSASLLSFLKVMVKVLDGLRIMDFVSQLIEQGPGWLPLIRLPYVSVSCPGTLHLSLYHTSCLSFSWLGKYDYVSLFELAAILLLMSVCLSTSQGGFLFMSQEETLIHKAHVSILWWQWSVEHQKIF